MIVHIDPLNAPLKDVPEALRDRRFQELAESLSEDSGIEILGGGQNGELVLSLRNLAVRCGSISRGQQTLISVLDALNVAAVDITADDVPCILGANAISFGISRGLQSSIPTLCRLLMRLEPTEIFDRLEEASAFVMNDRIDPEQDPSGSITAQMTRGAADDLRRHGLLDGPADDTYRQYIDRPTEVAPPEVPSDFRTEFPAFYSPFDEGGY